MVREGLAIVEEIGSKRMGVAHLDCSTGLAAAVGDWARAARLLGTAEALREQMGLHREPTDEETLAQIIGRTRAALGDSAFAAAESEGRAVSFDEAIAEARTWLAQRPNRQEGRKRSAKRMQKQA
jgi:hypothetical protein